MHERRTFERELEDLGIEREGSKGSGYKTYKDMPPKVYRDAGFIFGVDIYAGNERKGKKLDLAAFDLLAKNDKKFVLSKCSQITNDTRFVYNYAYTRQKGMIRGAWHFFTRKYNSKLKRNVTVDDQVAFTVWQVPRLGPGDVAPALDIEDGEKADGTRPLDSVYKDRGAEKTHAKQKDALVADCQKWLDDVEAKLGCTPWVYTGRIWDDLGGDTSARAQSMVEYPLWTVHRGKYLPGAWKYADVVVFQYAAKDRPTNGVYPFTKKYGLDPSKPYDEGTLDFNGLDFDFYPGTMHGLRGFAEMGRPGVVLCSAGAFIAHRELDGTLYLTTNANGAWSARRITSETDGEDPYLVEKGKALFAYHRSTDGRLIEEEGTASGAFTSTDLTNVAGLESVKVFHDPRVVSDGKKRHLVFWGTSEDGRLGKDPKGEFDDWYLVTHDGTRWGKAKRLLQSAGSAVPARGQPVPFMKDGELHVVGRAGTDGHLFDVSIDAQGTVRARDLFAKASFTTEPVRRAATYSPAVHRVGDELFVVFRGVRGDLWMLTWSTLVMTNLSVAAKAPKHAVGHPTSFMIGKKPHVVFRAVDRAVYDINFDGSRWTTTKLPCEDKPVADPTSASNGSEGLAAYRTMDGRIIAARFDGTQWTCAAAFKPT